MGSCHGMSIYKSPGGIVSVESLVALLGPFDPPSSHRLFYIKTYVDACIFNSWSMGNGPVLPAAEFSWTGAKEVQLSVHTVSCQRQGLILKKSKREDHAELPASASCLKKGQCWGWWSTTIVKVQASKKTAIMSFWQSQAEKGCQHNHQTAVVQNCILPSLFWILWGECAEQVFIKWHSQKIWYHIQFWYLMFNQKAVLSCLRGFIC